MTTGARTARPNDAAPAPKPSTPEIRLLDDTLVLWKRLSYGMMNAQVFRGTHAEHGDVVCKIIPVPPDPEEAERTRLYVESEADCGRRLRGPHIRRLHDYGDFDSLPQLAFFEGAYYLLFEWVPATLDGMLARGALAPVQVLRLAHAVGAGLTVAHESLPPIVHRDLKPHNVLVGDPDDLRTAKLADFGIARMAGAAKLTSAHGWTGTELYMAPEQFADSAHVTAKADLYAFGLLLWECLTGTVPLQAPGIAAQRALRINPEFPPLVVNGAACGELLTVLRWTLAPKPEVRPESAEKLVRGFADAGVRDRLWTQADVAAARATGRPAVPRVLVPPGRGIDERADGGSLELVLPIGAAGALERITPGVEWSYSLTRKLWTTDSADVGVEAVTRILEAVAARDPVPLEAPVHVTRSVRNDRSVVSRGPSRRVATEPPPATPSITPPGSNLARVAEPVRPYIASANTPPLGARDASAAASDSAPPTGPLLRPSPELAAVVGTAPRPRFEIANRLWEYIRRHGLQDAANKRLVHADEPLRKVLGGRTTVSMTELPALVNRNLRPH